MTIRTKIGAGWTNVAAAGPRVNGARFGIGIAIATVMAACSPTVKVEAPDRPIEINLNIRIEQEVRVKVERDLEDIFREDPALFGLPTEKTQP